MLDGHRATSVADPAVPGQGFRPASDAETRARTDGGRDCVAVFAILGPGTSRGRGPTRRGQPHLSGQASRASERRDMDPTP